MRVSCVEKLSLECEDDKTDTRGYLCNDVCFKSMNKYVKLKASLKELTESMKQKFIASQNTRIQRWKRGVPTDAKSQNVRRHLRTDNSCTTALNELQNIAPAPVTIPSPANSIFQSVATNKFSSNNLPQFQGYAVLFPRQQTNIFDFSATLQVIKFSINSTSVYGNKHDEQPVFKAEVSRMYNNVIYCLKLAGIYTISS